MNARDASTGDEGNPLQAGGDADDPLVVEGRLIGSFRELLLMLGGPLIFFVVGGALVDTGRSWGWAIVIPGALASLLTLLMALAPLVLLRTGARGFHVRGSLRPAREVAWANARGFRPAPGGERVVIYDYLGAAPEPRAGDPWFTPFTPGRVDLRGSHADPTEVAAGLDERRQRARNP